MTLLRFWELHPCLRLSEHNYPSRTLMDTHTANQGSDKSLLLLQNVKDWNMRVCECVCLCVEETEKARLLSNVEPPFCGIFDKWLVLLKSSQLQ